MQGRRFVKLGEHEADDAEADGPYDEAELEGYVEKYKHADLDGYVEKYMHYEYNVDGAATPTAEASATPGASPPAFAPPPVEETAAAKAGAPARDLPNST